MQIDTKNRHYNGTDFKPDILPKASAAPPNASYSGILECPCTDRINKTIDVTYQALNTGKCEKIVTHPTDCFNAAKKIDPSSSNAKQTTLDSKMYPSGCSLLHYGNGTTNVIYNTNSDGAECGGNSNKWFGYLNSSSTMPYITASSIGPTFSYHGPKTRGGANLQIYTLDSPTCLCNAGVKGSINGIPFSKNCLEEPQTDLLQQKNPTCWVDTYQVNMKQCYL